MRPLARALVTRLLATLIAFSALQQPLALRPVDAAPAAALTRVNQIGGTVGTPVAADGNRAFITIGPRLVALDVSVPSAPGEIAQWMPAVGGIDQLLVHNGRLYAAGSGSVYIFPTDVNRLELLGEIPLTSPARSVVADGNRLFIVTEATVEVFDISSGNSGAKLTSIKAYRADEAGFAVTGNVMYLAGSLAVAPPPERMRNYIAALDISDISHEPRPLGKVFTGGGGYYSDRFYALAAGTTLYVAEKPFCRGVPCYNSRLHVIDVRDPANLHILGSVTVGTPSSFALIGQRLYLAQVSEPFPGKPNLGVVDVSTPADPRLVQLYGDQTPRGLAVSGSMVFMTTESPRALRLLDATRPDTLPSIGVYQPPNGSVDDVVVTNGNLVTVGPDVRVYGLANPAGPALIGTAPVSGARVAASGTAVYVSARFGAQPQELITLDIADPAAPSVSPRLIIATSDTVFPRAARLYVHDQRLVAFVDDVVDHARVTQALIFDISVPTTPVEIARLSASTSVPSASGGYVYLGSEVVKLADLSRQPVFPSPFVPLESATGESDEAGWAFTYSHRDATEGLDGYSVVRPERPFLLGFIPNGAGTQQLRRTGRYLLSAHAGTIEAWDLGNYTAPQLLARLPAGQTPGLALHGNYLYLAGNVGGLSVIRFDYDETGEMPAPAPVYPEQGTELPGLQPLELRWQLPGGTTQYQLQVAPYNNDGPGIDLIRNAGPSYTIQPPLLDRGNFVLLPGMTYTWRVRATASTSPVAGSDPSWGSWSSPRFFSTPPPTAAATRAVTPANGALAATAGVRLQWEHPDKALFYWEVQVSKDPSFVTDPAKATQAVWWMLIHGGLSKPVNSWTTPPLEPGSTYYWRVRPRVQGDGAPVEWGPTWSLRTAG